MIRAFFILIISSLFLSGFSVASAQRQVPDNPVPFEEWLEGLKAEAKENGISDQILNAAFDGLTPNPKVVELDRRQPEFTQTSAQYLEKRVSPLRIKNGRKKMAEFKDVLDPSAKNIAVQKRFIAAIWGMETNYGTYTGNFNIVRSLMTLAYDMRRSSFFRKELLKALQILEEGHIAPDEMIGSWAGAMGQGQFMPTSFFAYAYDMDGDGKKNIWTNEADVFGSIGNYLSVHGWRPDQTWGREVKLPDDLAARQALVDLTHEPNPPRSCKRALSDHSKKYSLDEWQEMGVRNLDGSDLPKVTSTNIEATLLMPMGVEGPAYLTYQNFRSILTYNCSNLYALGVSLLSDELK
ncbi:lytic murein transglycosylase [Pseudemcibacter aquimaris]|uniref:lytic murein transglycosylase n=1 Tax=Pseudemcibacter aquimaris TaxID=2857064 RepID=UPI002011B5C4|nr:lytic murein transglycosylase [Pseudemcibacter aquimaris]MCC3860978.1 lytic murein transglycosylase [Pseudemcibacter aquimaris]WDU59796.1 lytic murein transglycosylase [Pseudemcibacter aquimaris]